MCGICGSVGRRARGEDAAYIAQAIIDQHRRGPDARDAREFDVGAWTCRLGHNRLSVIDLSADANQPMLDASTTAISYNGEVYNYIELRDELRQLGQEFRTRSDTEVILAAYRQWGIDGIARLNGMFAFALLDRAAGQRCILVRDRFGVKPLYFNASADRLLFASTALPIAHATSTEPNLQYAACGLAFGVYEQDDEVTQDEADPWSGPDTSIPCA